MVVVAPGFGRLATHYDLLRIMIVDDAGQRPYASLGASLTMGHHCNHNISTLSCSWDTDASAYWLKSADGLSGFGGLPD